MKFPATIAAAGLLLGIALTFLIRPQTAPGTALLMLIALLVATLVAAIWKAVRG